MPTVKKPRQYTVGFFLSMPHAASWNGKWSGDGEVHAIFDTFCPTYFESNKDKIIGTWFYNWGDGWGAEVTSRVLEKGERAKLSRKNKGFCGYDWMVKSILLVGDIYNSEDLKAVLQAQDNDLKAAVAKATK